MQIQVFQTAAQAAQAAAMLIAAQVIRKPNSVLGLPTGSTPIPVYHELVRMHRGGLVHFAGVTTFNLDEYCDLPGDHPCSYARFMQEQLFDHVDIAKENTHLPSGTAADMAQEGLAYDAAIRQAGGIDLQLLGIGHNGHIGFNEPGGHFVYDCHVTELTANTLEVNRRFFSSEAEMPRRAITVGVGTIMAAQQIVLLATGAEKAEAICKSLRGDVTPELPASILRTHSNVVYLLDEAAASGL